MKLNLIDEVLSNAGNGDSCSVYGRVSKIRNQKDTVFFDILDHTGKLQIVAEKLKYDDRQYLKKITPGSYVYIEGTMNYDNGQPEVRSNCLKVLSYATLPLSPSPWSIDGTDPSFGNQVFDYPGFYIANPQRAAVLRIETNFLRSIHDYFQYNRFTHVEPPILTDKTLYSEDNAVKTSIHGEDIFLTHCSTFELEPFALVFGKVYTISPAFRNEKGGSKKHLAEYTHTKAESLLVDIEDLMYLSGDMLFNSMNSTLEKSHKELKLLGKDVNTEPIHPKNHERMTYDEAVKIAQSKGSKIEYGEGLSNQDERILTKHVGDKYLWIQFPPFSSEGFPYKRKPGQKHLSMTCDLIAPNGAGEIIGVAEKTTDADELIENLIEKGKKECIRDYWQYILLRKYGLPQHGGIGASPERIVYGLFGLDHIRLTKAWPRYPDRKIRNRNFPLNPWEDDDIQRLIDKYEIQ